MSKSTITMDELLAGSEIAQLKTGDVVEGTVTNVRKHEVWIDLGASGVGVIMRREIPHGQVLEEGGKVTGWRRHSGCRRCTSNLLHRV